MADALSGFVGTFDQRPPAFSARKLGGRTAHRAARAGEPIALPPRTVTVDAIDLLEVSAGDGWLDVRIDLRCGPGTYVRSIARDLGERLGVGGHLHALRRTEAAGLRVEDGITPERLEALAGEGRMSDAVQPVGALLPLPELSPRHRCGLALRPRLRAGGRGRLAGAGQGRSTRPAACSGSDR